MGFIPVVVIALLALLCIPLTFIILLLARKLRKAVADMKEAERQRGEVVSFFTDFANSFRDYDDPATTMSTMAKYIAALVEADSVAIYEMRYNFLLAAGVYGKYPLLRRRDAVADNDPATLLRLLRREKIRIGEGFIGEVAASRESDCVADQRNDRRNNSHAPPAAVFLQQTGNNQRKTDGVGDKREQSKNGHSDVDSLSNKKEKQYSVR